MVGPTLIDIRTHIDDLATADGQFYVHCARTGDRPVPAVGKRFPDRATALAAVRATEQYRSALRRYDPEVPRYDLIVCQGPAGGSASTQRDGAATATQTRPAAGAGTRRPLVEFCHRVAGAVFEALSAAGHDGVESAVMATYVELAETVDEPDELCCCLLESMATEIEARLDAPDQADLLARAADRLEPVGDADDHVDAGAGSDAGSNSDAESDATTGVDVTAPLDDTDADAVTPLEATLAALEERGLVERYARSPRPRAGERDDQRAVVSIDGYALSPRGGRLPVLPLTVELWRQGDGRLPASVTVTATDDGWRLTVGLGASTDRAGLVSAPIAAVDG